MKKKSIIILISLVIGISIFSFIIFVKNQNEELKTFYIEQPGPNDMP